MGFEIGSNNVRQTPEAYSPAMARPRPKGVPIKALPGSLAESLARVDSKTRGPLSSPASVASNGAAAAGTATAAGGDPASLQTIPKSLQAVHPDLGEKDPLEVWRSKPEEPGFETSAKNEASVETEAAADDDVFLGECTPEELDEIRDIAGENPLNAAPDVDETDSGSEAGSDSDSEFGSDSDADSTTTASTRASNGGAGDPEDASATDATQAGAKDAGNGSSPVSMTPGRQLATKVKADALKHLFRGHPDAAELFKTVANSASVAARTNVTDFALVLRASEEKIEADTSLSREEKDAALAELDAVAKKYVTMVKADGLGKKSAFGVFYTGKYQNSVKIQKLTKQLGELSGSRTENGCDALRARMIELHVDAFLREYMEKKYGGEVDLTSEQMLGLMDEQAKIALERVSEACVEIAQKNDKSIRGAAKMLMLLTAIPDLLRGEEGANAKGAAQDPNAKGAQGKAAPKTTPTADPSATPSTPSTPSTPGPTANPGANPATNPATNPNANPATKPAATPGTGSGTGITYNFNAPVTFTDNSKIIKNNNNNNHNTHAAKDVDVQADGGIDADDNGQSMTIAGSGMASSEAGNIGQEGGVKEEVAGGETGGEDKGAGEPAGAQAAEGVNGKLVSASELDSYFTKMMPPREFATGVSDRRYPDEVDSPRRLSISSDDGDDGDHGRNAFREMDGGISTAQMRQNWKPADLFDPVEPIISASVAGEPRAQKQKRDDSLISFEPGDASMLPPQPEDKTQNQVDLLGSIDPSEAAKLRTPLGADQQNQDDLLVAIEPSESSMLPPAPAVKMQNGEDPFGPIDPSEAAKLPAALQATPQHHPVHGAHLQMPAVELPHQEEAPQQEAQPKAELFSKPTVLQMAARFEQTAAGSEPEPAKNGAETPSAPQTVKQRTARLERVLQKRELKSVDFLQPRMGSHLGNDYRNLGSGVETTRLRLMERRNSAMSGPGPQLYVQPTILTQPVRPAPAAASQA